MSSRALSPRNPVLAGLISTLAALTTLALVSPNALASTTTYVGSFGPLELPTGMAVEESTGNVLVAESKESEVVDVFGADGGAPSGDAPTMLTGEQTPVGSFLFDSLWVGLAVDNSTSTLAGSVYVVDPGGGTPGHAVVDRFKLSGNEFKYDGQLTGEPTPFAEPKGVATDADGDVYVSDDSAQRLREYSPMGVEIASFSVPGLERSVGVDARGDIYLWGDPDNMLAHGGVAEIKRSSDTATTIESIVEVPETAGAGAGAIDRATDTGYAAIGGRVIEYSLATGTAKRVAEFGAGTIEDVSSIAVDEETGKIYAADSGNGQVFIYQGAPSRFPLTPFITGEGEVTSTPGGLTCAAAVCSHEFEGDEVSLTAKAATGYEFAGWIGCEPIGAMTCKVNRAAATEVTAVFLKAAREGAGGSQGGVGATGPPGGNGKEGAQGRAGAHGPAGEIEIVTCVHVKGKQRCTAKLVSGAVRFTTAGVAARATLSRRGVVYAAGSARLAHGNMSLRLLPVRRLRPGRYTLTLVVGTGRHERISRESFTLS
jgi:DNA-binding beta-propeller fold protein YncE